VQDTGAFPCSGGEPLPPKAVLAERQALEPPVAVAPSHTDTDTDTARPIPEGVSLPSPPELATSCSPGPTTLCIAGRFKVEVAYRTTQGGGRSGMGQAIDLESLGLIRGGLFWFFGADNPEVLIKVIDACALAGKYWVFYSAGTNLGLKVTVTDTQTGKSATYTNPDLTAAPPVQDTAALPCS
jgi:hypothetical protein